MVIYSCFIRAAPPYAMNLKECTVSMVGKDGRTYEVAVEATSLGRSAADRRSLAPPCTRQKTFAEWLNSQARPSGSNL
jgi:hypothetical protein